MEYRQLNKHEICLPLFAFFHRRQQVTHCYRKKQGKWVICEVAFTEEWKEKEYRLLISCLHHTLDTGGMVMGVFDQDRLKGFVSVEAELFGSTKQYLELSSLHVSEDYRRKGMGKVLFQYASGFARKLGARALYISAHSSMESIAFYRAMGCIEAKEYSQAHVTKEPCDCQIEYLL